MSIPDSATEALRLSSLSRYAVLDTPAEASFDRLTALASRLFEVPIALVTLVDRERLWFKARHGSPVCEMAREGTFCNYAIQQDEVSVIADAALDPRFCHLPIVTGEPFVRFYAGAPLIAPGGFRLGTLCLLDAKPRQFSPAQVESLRDLATLTMEAMEARRTTQRMALEAAERQQAEAHKQAVFNAALDGIITINHEGRVLELNHAAETMFGYPAAQAVGQELSELIIPPIYREAHRCGMAHFLTTGEGPALNKRLELLAMNSAGKEFPVELAITRIVKEGSPVFTGYIRDISNRRERERRLRMLESSVAHARDAIIIVEAMPSDGVDPRILYVNQAFTESTGYASEEAVGQTPKMLYGPDTDLQTYSKIRQALATWQPLVVDLLNYRKDGTSFWIEMNLVPVADDKGQFTHWVSVRRDITERKQAQKALEDNFVLLRGVIEGTDDTVFIKDRDCRYLLINPAGASLLGTTPEAVVGKDDSAFFTAENVARIQALDRDIMESGASRTYESTEIIGGVERFFLSTKNPYRDTAGNVLGVIGIVREITEQLRAAEALRAAKEEAENANLAKSEFLSRMSHELRTPLNAILGFGQLLEMDAKTDRQLENISHILKGGKHLLGLINEVLDIARIESGHMELCLEPLSVGTIFGEAVSLVQPLATQRNIHVGKSVALFEKAMVLADNQRLRQVLLNLLSNAVKYNRTGGTVSLSCAAGTKPGFLRLSVTDTGHGLAADKLGKLFTPFERLGAEHTAVEGTGIGLALSKRLAEAMGGSMGVESIVGRGSTFYLELPAAESLSTEIRQPPVFTDVQSATEQPATVLCIEDNLSNYTLVERVLETNRPHVRLLGAMQGQLGLDMARQHCPDLILLDLQLPDLPGDQLLRQLRADENTREIPVIMVSADATKGQAERLLGLGAQGYLTKPLDIRSFLGAVDEALATKKRTATGNLLLSPCAG